jgi:hypothetical protein
MTTILKSSLSGVVIGKINCSIMWGCPHDHPAAVLVRRNGGAGGRVAGADDNHVDVAEFFHIG